MSRRTRLAAIRRGVTTGRRLGRAEAPLVVRLAFYRFYMDTSTGLYRRAFNHAFYKAAIRSIRP